MNILRERVSKGLAAASDTTEHNVHGPSKQQNKLKMETAHKQHKGRVVTRRQQWSHTYRKALEVTPSVFGVPVTQAQYPVS